MMTQTLYINDETLNNNNNSSTTRNKYHQQSSVSSNNGVGGVGGLTHHKSHDNLSSVSSSLSNNSNSNTPDHHHSNTNLGPGSSESSAPPPATSINKLTPFEKLVDSIRNNQEYKKEMMLNKLIGFYKLGSEIGTGNFSQVKLGLHLLTREKVAVKILNKTKLDEKTQRLLLREISSMQKISHPNIIRLYEVIHTQERLFMCMEYAPEGELYSRISNEGKVMERDARIIFSQVISAVHHMHSHNIIHRDIKAENIFFANLQPIIVKIGDFGFSIEASQDRRLNTYCGSPPYAAPELFKDDNYIGIYVDIWALGVLLFFIVTGAMPFRAETVSKLKRVILNGEYIIPESVSDACQLLIRGILKPVPIDRFTIKEIMQSAWLDGERFNEPLEPYHLHTLGAGGVETSSSINNNSRHLEETWALRILEHLGITREFLIFSNINLNAGGGTNSNNHHTTTLQNGGVTLPSHYSTATSSTLMTSLISNKQLAWLLSQPQYYKHYSALSIELKQYINGAFRIVFHLVQKRVRHEYNSEYKPDSLFNRLYTLCSVRPAPPSSHHNDVGGHHVSSSSSSSSSAHSQYVTTTKFKRETFESDPDHQLSLLESGEENKKHPTAYTRRISKYNDDDDDDDDYVNDKNHLSVNNNQPNSIFVRLNSKEAAQSPAAVNQTSNGKSGGTQQQQTSHHQATPQQSQATPPSKNVVNANSIFVKHNANSSQQQTRRQSISGPQTARTTDFTRVNGGGGGKSAGSKSHSAAATSPQNSKLCTIL